MRDAHDRQNVPSAPEPAADFDAQYRPLLREVFVEMVRQDLLGGDDAAEQARAYAERGKPDFVLAYLLVSDLTDAEKREIYAHAHERRAALTEQRARQFSQEFNRPFPLLFTDAAKDRSLARQIRSGRAVQRGAGRQLPLI
jgi:hypothetical protein